MSLNFANKYEPRHCILEDRWFDATVVINCSGVLDMLTAPVLQQHIVNALTENPTAMIIDLTDIEFLASHGMGVLIATHDLVTPSIPFSVVADGPVTRRPRTLIDIDNLLIMHATLHAALEDSQAATATDRRLIA
ncbi:STAS domain-containing protein [soil metagenome]